MLFNARLLMSLVVITVLGVSSINAVPVEASNGALVRRGRGGAGGGRGGGAARGGHSPAFSGHAKGGHGGPGMGFRGKVVVKFKKITKWAYDKGIAAAKKKIAEANKPGAWYEEAQETIEKFIKKKAKDGKDGKDEYLERLELQYWSSDMPLYQPGCTSDGSDIVEVEFDDEGTEEDNAAMLDTIASKFVEVVRPEDLCPELARDKAHAGTSQLMSDGRILLHNDKTETDDMGYYAPDSNDRAPNPDRKSQPTNFGQKFKNQGMREKFAQL
ncbi:hypothetical protein HGRIS_005564 [Hohenbuehelia grisea]|uniref:Uncharacterized protein n=1 Tax=Hohenbuehelia grisea TaxID=104357 RepID=A0ABR3JZH7_9AGAR